jgi:transcriptional regulator with XRE-family HTH domain
MSRRYPRHPRRRKLSNTTDLLDKAKKLCTPQTDYRLAKTLKVSVARMSNWRRGKAHPDALACMALARHLGMEFADVLAYVEEDRARAPEAKLQWAAVLPRLLPSIAIGSFLLAGAQDLIGGKIYTPGTAPTVTAVQPVVGLPIYTLCAIQPWSPEPRPA